MPSVNTDQLRKASALTIKAYRKRRELTQQEVSDLAQLSRSYISELEDGKHLPTIETIFRLAEPFGIKPMTLVKEIHSNYCL